MTNARILIGCDPEVFVKNSAGGLISAHNLIPGTKETPFPVYNGAIQVDGVAAEFNTTPTEYASDFSSCVQSVFETLKGQLSPNAVLIEPSVTFSKDYFNSLPDEVRILGCNPDYNAWTEKLNPTPDGNSTFMRTASGHLHIGWTKDENVSNPHHFQDCCRVIRQLDYTVGLFTLLWDKSADRRSLYGKAGAFRPKSYGVEYRTPSNMWLRHPKLWMWLAEACQKTVKGLMSNQIPYFPDTLGNLAQKVIDSNEVGYPDSPEFKNNVYQHLDIEWPNCADKSVPTTLARRPGKKKNVAI